MLSFNEYLKEQLTPFERKIVDDKKLDTSTGEEISSHIIPKGQHHTEIPLIDHFHNDVKTYVNSLNVPHRENNDPKGKMVQGKYTFLNKHELLHPSGSKRTVLSVIRDNPELLKKYNDIHSSAHGKIDAEVPEPPSHPNMPKFVRWTSNNLDHDKLKIIVSRHPHAIQGKSSSKKPWQSCSELGSGKEGEPHLDPDVESGGHVAYLVHKNEPNPNDPETAIGRVSLNPFVSASGHRILRAAPKRYGADDQNNSFHESVKKWAEKHFPMKDDEYTLDPDVYQDDYHHEHQKSLYKQLSPEKKSMMSQIMDLNIKNGTVNPANIKRANHAGYLQQHHIDGILEHPNMDHTRKSSAVKEIVNQVKSGDLKLSTSQVNKIIEHGNESSIDDLMYAHTLGHINMEDDHHITNIIKHPNKKLVYSLFRYAGKGPQLRNRHFDLITQDPKHGDIHNMLMHMHANGKIRLESDNIDDIIKHDVVPHEQLIKWANDGKLKLTPAQVDHITKN